MVRAKFLLIILVATIEPTWAQDSNSYLGLELGVSSTHSFWEDVKPHRNDIRLKNISQASPNIKINYKKKMGQHLWIDIGVKAQPISWKRSIYYEDANYLRKRTRLSTVGVWQIPVVASWHLPEHLFKTKFIANWAIEAGFITSLANGSLDLNLGQLTISNGPTIPNEANRFDNGKLANYLFLVGTSYQVRLPNEKLVTLRANAVLGTRVVFREFVDFENNYTIRSNGSYLQLTLGYYLPIKTKTNSIAH